MADSVPTTTLERRPKHSQAGDPGSPHCPGLYPSISVKLPQRLTLQDKPSLELQDTAGTGLRPQQRIQAGSLAEGAAGGWMVSTLNLTQFAALLPTTVQG